MLHRSNTKRLLELIEENTIDKNARPFRNLKLSILYLTSNNDEVFKVNVERYILVGKEYTENELLNLWNKIYSGSVFGLQYQNKPDTAIQAVQRTKLFFNIIKRSKKSPLKHFIKDANPRNITLTKARPLGNNA